MSNYQLNFIQPGDRIITPKSVFGLIKHHAIYIGRIKGEGHVIENILHQGVVLTPLKSFLSTNPEIIRIESFIGSPLERQNALIRANASIGKRYHLVDSNCEHLANHIQFNKKFSIQAQLALFILFIFLIYKILRSI